MKAMAKVAHRSKTQSITPVSIKVTRSMQYRQRIQINLYANFTWLIKRNKKRPC